jgi:hypothetical protein
LSIFLTEKARAMVTASGSPARAERVRGVSSGGKGQASLTFGYCHDEDGDACDDESQKLGPVDVVLPRFHAAITLVKGIGHPQA